MEPDRAVQPRAHSRAHRTQTEVAAQWSAAPGRGLARPARAALLRTGRDARRRSGGRRSARSLPPLPRGGGTPRQGTHRRASAPPRLPGSGSPPGNDAALAGDRRRRSIRRRVASHRLSGVFHRREHRSRARIDLRRFNRQFGRRPRNERMRHGSARFPWPRPAGNCRAVLRRVGSGAGPRPRADRSLVVPRFRRRLEGACQFDSNVRSSAFVRRPPVPANLGFAGRTGRNRPIGRRRDANSFAGKARRADQERQGPRARRTRSARPSPRRGRGGQPQQPLPRRDRPRQRPHSPRRRRNGALALPFARQSGQHRPPARHAQAQRGYRRPAQRHPHSRRQMARRPCPAPLAQPAVRGQSRYARALRQRRDPRNQRRAGHWQGRRRPRDPGGQRRRTRAQAVTSARSEGRIHRNDSHVGRRRLPPRGSPAQARAHRFRDRRRVSRADRHPRRRVPLALLRGEKMAFGRRVLQRPRRLRQPRPHRCGLPARGTPRRSGLRPEGLRGGFGPVRQLAVRRPAAERLSAHRLNGPVECRVPVALGLLGGRRRISPAD